MHIKLIFSIPFFIFFIIGCAKPNLNTFNQAYYNGNAKKAYEIAISHLTNDKKNQDQLLWQVQAGIVSFYLGNKNSSKLLNQADALMQENIQNFAKSFFGNIGAILSSDTNLSYPIYLYEASMVNYYLALDSMSNHNFANARVYLNQALERQNDAKDYYAREIKYVQKHLDNIKKTDKNSSQEQQYLAIGMDFARQGDKDIVFNEHYINPMIIYMKVLFELTQNNFSAINALGKELDYILQEDKEIIKSRQNGDNKRYIWFIIEDGKITSKDTFKISIPLPINPDILLDPIKMAIALNSPHSAIIVTALSGGIMLNYAEPKLINKEIFAKKYSVDNQQAKHLFELSNLMQTEFYKRLPAIRTRAILRSIPPAITAYIAEKTGENSFGFRGFGILTSLIHRTAISADIRMITALPDSFYILRLENDGKEKELNINGSKSLIFKAIDSNKDDIIYIRNTSKNVYFKRLLTSQGDN